VIGLDSLGDVLGVLTPLLDDALPEPEAACAVRPRPGAALTGRKLICRRVACWHRLSRGIAADLPAVME
jgi:hypothetical protein